jgi:Tol biopolymer transport system component
VAWLLLALAAGSSVACAAGSAPILFTSDRDGDLEIYRIDPNEREEQNLTNSAADEFSPRLSPDGGTVVFLSGTENGMSLEVMLVDGTERKRVGPVTGRYSSYRWSPDSRRIAYVAQKQSDSLLYVVNADGSEPVLLTAVLVDHVGGWSPGGDSVVFSVTTEGEQGVWVRNPDGVNEFRRTEYADSAPVWSPDSKRIAFLSSRDGNPELYVMLADGTEQKRLTNNDAAEYHVSWSPNGKRLLFVSERDGNPEIYVTDVKGDKQTRLTTNNVRDDEPVWSPNGRKIAFVSYLDGDADIFVMGSDGGNQVRLTNNDFDDISPSW